MSQWITMIVLQTIRPKFRSQNSYKAGYDHMLLFIQCCSNQDYRESRIWWGQSCSKLSYPLPRKKSRKINVLF